MARISRKEVAGGIQHVYARGNDGCVIYRDDVDRKQYLRLLADVVPRFRWRCLAYCLMTNHVHLLVETSEPNLGLGMHRLHSEHVRLFNRRHERTGHLFGGRFGSVLVESEAQLWAVASYLAANPVKAGLCQTPEQWRWGSHGATMDQETRRPAWLDTARLLELLSGFGGDSRDRYGAYVRERVVLGRSSA
ncbi:MAG: toxin RelE [Conexibacter sp.]|nr:toxin RelE [Conexibacter sp.]